MKTDLICAARLLTAAAAIAALASCGGGGGGGSGGSPSTNVPTASLALTPSNAQNVAGDATLASLDASDKAPSLALAEVRGDPLPRTHVLSRFMVQQIDRLSSHLQSSPPALLNGAATTVVCATGNGSRVIDVVGTAATVTFNACSDFPGESINGSFTISNMVVTATGFSGSESANLTFSLSGFPDQTFAGNFDISVETVGTVTTITLSGTEILIGDATGTERLGSFTLVTSFDTGATTDTVTFNFASTEIGGSVNITTLVPFQTSTGRTFPHAGAILITGAMGSKIKVTVLGDESAPAPQVRIELDADGDGTFETVQNRNWSDLAA